jgi:DNA-binding response OmpR family regulator
MKIEFREILRKSTILLVDDNVELLKKFEEVLILYVDQIYIATNGKEALKLYKEKEPTIVMTDVNMPYMDGLSLSSFIRKMNDEIPIVVISAYSEVDTLLKFVSLNLVEYIVKPINFNQLIEILEKCANRIIAKGLIEFHINEMISYSFSKKTLLSRIDKKLIALSPKEIDLIELLIKYANRLVNKEEIESTLYNYEGMSTPAFNNLISKIRKKIGAKSIVTVSNLGIMLVK